MNFSPIIMVAGNLIVFLKFYLKFTKLKKLKAADFMGLSSY